MKWIKCSDRLPEMFTDCLCYVNKESGIPHMIVAMYAQHKDNKNWTDDGCVDDRDFGITHWMPLPEEPNDN